MIKPNDKRYSDSEEGALELLNDFCDAAPIDAFEDDPQFMPDPQVKGVWLVAVPSLERAFIVYTQDNDFEECDNYKLTMAKYFPYY